MPINFTIHKEDGFYLAQYIGTLTDEVLLNSFLEFFKSPEWNPHFNELADLSEVNGVKVTLKGIRQMATQLRYICEKYNASPVVAVYAPKDLAFGLARMYAAAATTFQTIRVFRNFDEAKAWLLQNTRKPTTEE